MPDLTTATRYRFTMYTHLVDQVAVTRLYYRVLSITGAGVLTWAQVLTAVDAVWAPKLQAAMADPAIYDGSTWERASGLPPFEAAAVERGSFGPGTAGADPLPRQVCPVIQKRTEFKGRAQRGRTYLPFPPRQLTQTTGGEPIWTTAAYVIFDAFAAQLKANITVTSGGVSAILVPVIHGPTPAVNDDIIDALTDTGIGTQRRRGDFGRQNKKL